MESEIALAHAQLSARQQAEGAYGPALESITTALALAPGAAALWAQFSDLIRYFNLRHPVPAAVRELLSMALEHPAVDPGNLVRPSPPWRCRGPRARRSKSRCCCASSRTSRSATPRSST
jgi:hypothetical protein